MTARFVVDASVVLKAYFPDEEGHVQAQAVVRDWALGRIQITAPPLLIPEVTNGVLVALRRERISQETAYQILQQVEDLSIPIQEPPGMQELLNIATQYDRTAYDAAYLSLVMRPSTLTLLTGDKRLYNAVKDKVKRITWIEDYEGEG